MPRVPKELTAIEVRRLTKPGRYTVGGVRGLMLYVTKSGARSWVLRIVIGSKRREAGLGPYPEVGLAEAREKAREFRRAVEQGHDPIAVRVQTRQALRSEQTRRITFETAAKHCHAAKAAEFKSEKHRRDWINSLAIHAFPIIGKLSVDQIDVPAVLRVLHPIWTKKTETATRVRQRLEAVLAWAAVSGHRKGDNPARWPENLDQVLPKPNKVRKVEHFKALPWQQAGQFMADLREREGIGSRALEFTILTAARSADIRGATWDEIDLNEQVWTIPGDRMKTGKLHRVPLSPAAVKVLKAVPRLSDKWIFSSPDGGQVSTATMLAVCKRMGVDATPHGFRSTFKDWARACTRYPDEVSELALAHVNSDKTRAAYARDELLPQRKRLMNDWAKFLSRPLESADVARIGGEV